MSTIHTDDRMTRAARRHAEAMSVLDAAAAFKLTDEALTESTEATYAGATEAYSTALDALIEAALAMEVER